MELFYFTLKQNDMNNSDFYTSMAVLASHSGCTATVFVLEYA